MALVPKGLDIPELEHWKAGGAEAATSLGRGAPWTNSGPLWVHVSWHKSVKGHEEVGKGGRREEFWYGVGRHSHRGDNDRI